MEKLNRHFTSALAGLGVGLGIMYFFDSHHGRKRRSAITGSVKKIINHFDRVAIEVKTIEYRKPLESGEVWRPGAAAMTFPSLLEDTGS